MTSHTRNRPSGFTQFWIGLLLAALPWLATAQSLQFATTFGGSGSDTVFAVTHHDGFSYVAGRTTSADFPVTDGSTYQGDSGETGDIFVAKLNAGGQILAATLLGGSGPDFANGIAITDGPGVPDGNGGETFPKVITISGWTGSTDFRTLNPIQAANGGKTDAVIAQFDLSLNLLFSTYLGGAEDDQFAGLTPIYGHDFMFFGFTSSTDFPFPTPNAAPSANTVKNLTNNADGLLVKFAQDRTVPMATLFRRTASGNGTQNEVILAAAFGINPVDPLSPEPTLYVTGWTDGDFFRNTADPTGSGKRIFMSKIDPFNGGRGYSRVLGGSSEDIGQAIAITPEGVVVFGQTTSTDLPNPQPLFQAGHGGGADAVLVGWQHAPANPFEPIRQPYVAYLGGSGDDSGRALVAGTEPEFNIVKGLHFAGVTGSANLPLPAAPQHPPAQANYGGGATDGFFGRLGVRTNPESTGPPLLLEVRDLTFHGTTDDDAFTAVGVKSESGGGFTAAAVGAVRRSAATGQSQIVRHDPSGPTLEEALFAEFGVEVQVLPDLTIPSVTAPAPLVQGMEGKVTVVILNKGQAAATGLSVSVSSDLPPSLPTCEILRVEHAGEALSVVPGGTAYSLPAVVTLAPAQTLELEVTVKVLTEALRFDPPNLLLITEAHLAEADLMPEDNITHTVIPVAEPAPDLQLELVSAAQDPAAGVNSPRARYEFRVRNVGSAAVETAEVVLTGLNLKNATYQLDGGAVIAMGDLDGAGEKSVPVGPLGVGGEKSLVVQGEPARPNEGTKLTGRGLAAGDENPENNTPPPGETVPGPGPDYAVSILSQTIGFEDRDNATILTLRTIANLTLTLPESLSVDRVADAVLTTRHVGTGGVVTADPGNLGSCERLDERTTRCTFPARAFFQADQPPGTPGVIRLEVREDMEIVLPPEGPRVTFSVDGDGQDPTTPNNFAEPDLSQKGAVTVTRTALSAQTVLIRPGLVGNVVTQRLRVHNAGPGTVQSLKLRVFNRLTALPEPAYAAFIQAPQVVAGAESGVTVTVIDNEDRIDIATLAPGGEVVIEFVDVREVLNSGVILLEAPPGANLLIGTAVKTPETQLSFVETPLRSAGQMVDMAVAVTEQRIEIESRAGGRVPVRVTELQVWHRGDGSFSNPGPPVDNVVLTLRGSGVNLGSGLQQRFDSGSTADLLVAGTEVTRPEAPGNPNVLRVPLGRFLPGQTNRYVLRDDVAEPDRDGLLGLSGDVLHPLYDPVPGNNVFSRDTEYEAFQSTLDYAVFIRGQSVTTFLDPHPIPPRTVLARRTRFECTTSGSQGASALPPMQLRLQLAGPLFDIRLVPKDATVPAPPQTALQWRQENPLSHEVTADFDAVIARDYFLETVSGAPSLPYQTVADLTGDGEVPAAGNNNRAIHVVEDDLENFADVVVTGRPFDLDNDPLLRFKEEVRTSFFVKNRSQTVAARNVRLTFGERYRGGVEVPAGSLVRTVRVIGVSLPAATADCLLAGEVGDCELGDIPPGGQVTVILDTRFESLPPAEENHPLQVLLDLRAIADNEVNHFNNDQTVTYPTRIPVVDIDLVVREGDEINVLYTVLRPSAVPTDGVVLECADSLLGPWIPCTPPLPIGDDSRFIRPRGY